MKNTELSLYNRDMSEKSKGNLILLMTAILWGTGFISQKLGHEVMPPMTFNAVRQLLAGVVLTPIAIRGFRKSGYLSQESNRIAQIEYRKRKLLTAGFLCGAFMLTGTATQQIGLLTVSAGKSGFISSLYIVIVPFFSVLVGPVRKEMQLRIRAVSEKEPQDKQTGQKLGQNRCSSRTANPQPEDKDKKRIEQDIGPGTD